MNYSEIVSVSKMSGLYQIHKKRNDGLIIKSLSDGKVIFAASRNHVFTPLENITIYTENEPVELKEIFISIKKNISKNPLPNVKTEGNVLKGFFEVVLPEYDKDKVYTSDITKIIKMYQVLDANNLIDSLDNQKDEKAVDTKEEATEVIKVAKKTKKADESVAKETPKTAKKTAKKTTKKED
jgi:phage tail sheath protein FI